MARRLFAASALLLAVSAHAYAQAPQAQPTQAPTAAAQAAPEQDDDWIADRQCLRHTGSRITIAQSRRQARLARQAAASDNPSPCAPLAGRAYTRDDLLRTGQMDIAQALRRLDPAMR